MKVNTAEETAAVETTRHKPSEMDALREMLVENLLALKRWQSIDLSREEWTGPARGPAQFINTRFHKKDENGPRFSIRTRSDKSGWLIIRTK